MHLEITLCHIPFFSEESDRDTDAVDDFVNLSDEDVIDDEGLLFRLRNVLKIP